MNETRENNSPQKVVIVSKAPAYAKVAGVLALITAILAFLIPIFGTLLIVPMSIVFGLIALWGRSAGLGIATLIILVIKLAISPVFWVNLLVSAAESDAVGNQALSIFIVVGIILMFIFLFIRGKKYQ